MKRLIVTADDFGLTEKVNQGIIEAHRDGIVTTTSLMANGSAFRDAMARASEAPALSIGAHLNLTEGEPTSAKSEVRSLVNGDGQMRFGPVELGRKLTMGQ